jgi:N4-gp56 family major capsid protein
MVYPVNITSVLTQDMMTYYERVFLARAEMELILKEGAQMRTHSKYSGETINFTQYQPMDISTTALTEASNPDACMLTASTVSVTLAEYGRTTITSKLHELTSIDANFKEAIAVVGQNMGETINALTGLQLASATAYFANSHNISNVSGGDVLCASSIREIVKTLELNKAPVYSDGYYLGKTNPYSKFSLLGDSTWIAAKEYSDVKDLYKGEMGELYQVRWLLNKQLASASGNAGAGACSTLMYYSYVHGRDAFGCFDLEGDQPKLYILANQTDSVNTTGRRSYISWAGAYACKILNSNWALVGKFPAA